MVADGPMQHARVFHSMTLLPDGRVLVVGGEDPAGERNAPHSTTEIFDPGTETWSPGPDLSEPRFDHSATLSAGRQGLPGRGHRRKPPEQRDIPPRHVRVRHTIASRTIDSRAIEINALKQPRWCAGVAPFAVSLRTLPYTRLKPSGVLWEVWFSSWCLLRTLATKAKVLAINIHSPILGGGQPAREDGFRLFTRTPVEWGTFGRQKGCDAFATGVWILRIRGGTPITPQALTLNSALPI